MVLVMLAQVIEVLLVKMLVMFPHSFVPLPGSCVLLPPRRTILGVSGAV